MADRLEQLRRLVQSAIAQHGLDYAPLLADVDWLISEVDRLRAARDVDRLGYAVALLDNDGQPGCVGPAVHGDRKVADQRHAEEIAEGTRAVVVELIEAEEARP